MPSIPSIGAVFDADRIPEALRAMPRWAPWKAVWNERRGKFDKIPFTPAGRGLSTRDASKWFAFDAALAALKRQPGVYAGLGFVMTGCTEVVGIDLDRCVVDGELNAWARRLVDDIGSYAELSPSRMGVRILALGHTPQDFTDHGAGIEVYAGNTPRFLTVTGDVVRPLPLAPAPEAVLQRLEQQHRRAPRSAEVIQLDMPELLSEVTIDALEDLELPEPLRTFVRVGPLEEEPLDGSLVLHTLGVTLLNLGYSEQQIISMMALNEHVMDVALAHRSQDADRALLYLWVEHVQKARSKARPPASVVDDFDDVSEAAAAADAASAARPSLGSAAPGAPQMPRFAVQDYTAFTRPRRRSWLAKRVLPRAALAVIYGASASGKSFFALDLVACVARGVPWRGHKCEAGRVLYICAEGQEDFRRRVRAYTGYHGEDPALLERMRFIEDAPNLMDLADTTLLLRQIKAAQAEMGAPFDLIVIDTLAQSMVGGNENSGEDVGKVLGHCTKIHRATGALITLVHHSGKDESKGARGWSGLRAAADVEFEIVRDGQLRTATLTKLKGGEDGQEWGFKLKTVVLGQDEDGEDEVSCVVGYTEQTVKHDATGKGAHQQLVLQFVEGVCVLLDSVTENEILERVAERLAPPTDGKRDRRKELVGRALQRLLDEGSLVRVGQGSIALPPVE